MTTPRYDVETKDNGKLYFIDGPTTYTATVRDNQSGKTYSSTNYDASAARSGAFEQAKRDN